ncbi:hypothetical protein [Mesorhizobium sp. SEMIA 3007]|uniref:hypothetical protein n=1 Tax=Mesorhizobium sp. SEMIA 3007 TaxID=1862350 RepID=UPI001495B79B|nr:hypothetical protein [Mesorhizobium sp. SEMIA 3007]
MTNSNKLFTQLKESTFWKLLRGEVVYNLDGLSTPQTINESLGPDPFWNEMESLMCFDDVEVGLDETKDRSSARYFGLYPGKTDNKKIKMPGKEEIRSDNLRMETVLWYLIDQSVPFFYDKTFDSESDRGIRFHDGGTAHFYKKNEAFYLGSVFLKKI